MKPKNTNARKQARRQGALNRLMSRSNKTDEQQAEIATLRQRLATGNDNFPTKKLLANASYARRQHRVGKLTR